MPEIRKVSTNVVDEKCQNCGQGWMRPNGIVLTTNPPQFQHTCTNCGHKQNYTVKYPQTF